MTTYLELTGTAGHVHITVRPFADEAAVEAFIATVSGATVRTADADQLGASVDAGALTAPGYTVTVRP